MTKNPGWNLLAYADPSVTSHAIGRVSILNAACDIILGARARREAVTGGMGGHQAAKPMSGEAMSGGSRLPVLFAMTETGG